MELAIFPSAAIEIQAAFDWYSEIQTQLGEAFVDELDAGYTLLLRQPGIGARRYAHFLPDESLRFWAMDRFPFLIFYRYDATHLQVIRLLHEKRDITAAWH